MDFNKEKTSRRAGILLHPSSLPAPFGIGDFGYEAYNFINFLKVSGQTLWQTLPLTPPGKGNSPYQSYSAFAGNTLLISPHLLRDAGLVSDADLSGAPKSPFRVDYSAAAAFKNRLFHIAFQNFENGDFGDMKKDFALFEARHADWLPAYTLYRALRSKHGETPFSLWPEPDRHAGSNKKAFDRLFKENASLCRFHAFTQYLFYDQWSRLKDYAHQNAIILIGDLPIFVSHDSSDVWSHPELFALDASGRPALSAGVPPDAFSATGQHWGNPLYAWENHKKTGYSWWIRRIKHQLTLSDAIRIDHFRGFEAYWAIPGESQNAMTGSWKKGPGADLFQAIQDALGNNLPIIAEDLGLITPEVHALRDAFQFPGMKVLQFGFDPGAQNAYLPHSYGYRPCICYTGTHDNDTAVGWYQKASPETQNTARMYMNTDGSSIHLDLIRTALSSTAMYAVYPLQDVLGYGSDARMNVPGSESGNWEWRFSWSLMPDWIAGYLSRMTALYGRRKGSE